MAHHFFPAAKTISRFGMFKLVESSGPSRTTLPPFLSPPFRQMALRSLWETTMDRFACGTFGLESAIPSGRGVRSRVRLESPPSHLTAFHTHTATVTRSG